ncbi:PilZ domain-containing protein [Rubripirellula sp.]|nr:PilZ domain-containing protein [Rubripirellula sp.]MDB4749514.1 PilZ domain-containing protein [Rubripirellula sp.]
MTDRTVSIEDPADNRKQRRFKTNEAQALACRIEVDGNEASSGTVIDLSNSGMRLLGGGQYRVGQEIRVAMDIDLPTDVFHAEVRYVEPWVGGQTILGCSLTESIGDAVLHKLADQGFLNRRSDPRIEVIHPAKMFWPLHPDRVDIEVRDYSNGGLMIHTEVAIPDDKRLRVCIDGVDDNDLCVETKLQWKRLSGDGCLAGLAFVHHDAPQRVARVLGLTTPSDMKNGTKKSVWDFGSLLYFTLAAVLLLVVGAVVAQISGVNLPWGMIFSR